MSKLRIEDGKIFINGQELKNVRSVNLQLSATGEPTLDVVLKIDEGTSIEMKHVNFNKYVTMSLEYYESVKEKAWMYDELVK